MSEQSMFLADTWKDYEVLDCGQGMKLERWGRIVLARPDPQTIWPPMAPEDSSEEALEP